MRNMREAYNSNQSLNVPTLLGGLLIMLAIVGLAFLLLLCCNGERSTASSSRGSQTEREHDGMNERYSCDEIEERVIVIMAGDVNPTFIAKPASLAAPDIESSCMGI